MVTVVAQNQAITAVNGVTSDILSDPIDLGDNDRATVMWNVHYLWAFDAGGGGATGTASWQAQISNDGVFWLDISGATDTATAATGSTPKRIVFTANGQFLRFKMSMVSTAGDLAGCAMDLHVKFDHV